ncbi:MAG: aminopeptidase [Candidatus Aenigmarchaeota archaeon]|nr:aminopeptidase [Candidatus Aenigmarchaeota archaeon]
MKHSLDKVSEIVWKQCLRIKKGEQALIVTDKGKLDIANSLLRVGEKLCICKMIEIPKAKIHGEEPPGWAAEKMLGMNAIIAPTSFSITHTRATKQASGQGARVITMPNIEKETFLRAIPIDYQKMKQFGERVKRFLSGNEIRVETRAGTDLTVFEGDRKIIVCAGIPKKGETYNLPTGEVAFAPMEGKTEGKLIVDASCAPDSETKFGKIGLVKKPFRIDIEGGEAVDCENGVLWKWITHAKNGSNVAEFAIGINPKARIIGNVLEDEKVLGTSHVAFGTNANIGGVVRSDIHLDAVFRKPTISVDGKIIIRKGKFLF